MSVSCVVLDVGGVLERTPQTGWLDRWEREVGLEPGTTDQRLGAVWRAGSLGTMTEPEVRAAVRRELQVPEAELGRFWDLLWQEYLGSLNGELLQWFRGLRPRYRTGILSNSFVGARERERDLYGFEDACDIIVYSHEVGLSKPDPAIYALTARRLDAAPGQIVFLDDNPMAVEGARRAGWHAVLFGTTAQAVRDVEACLGG